MKYIKALSAHARKDEKGFTLVELIIVIAIIGILIAIAIPVYSGIQDRAEMRTLEASAKNGLTMALVQHQKGLDFEGITAEVSKLDTDKITHIVDYTPDQDGYFVAAVVTESLQGSEPKYAMTSGKFSNKPETNPDGDGGGNQEPDPIATVPTGLCPDWLPFDRYATGTELLHKNGQNIGTVPAGWILTPNIYGQLDFLVGNACDPEVGDWEQSWSLVPNPRA